MKLIGLDVGTKRIGIAKADTSTRIALPDGFLPVNGQEFSEIARLARLYNTNIFIIGLPRSNQGNETKQTAYVRRFASQLYNTIPGARIFFQDESLTSVEAENRLKARKKAYQKGEIDAEAAAIILQDCIEHMAANTQSANPIASSGATTPAGAPNTATAAQTSSPGALQGTSANTGASLSTNPSNTPQTAPNSPKNDKNAKKAAKTAEKAAKKAQKSLSSGKSSKKLGKTIGLIAGAIILVLGLTFGGAVIWYNASITAISNAECKFSTSDEQAASTESVPDVCKFIRFNISGNESVAQIGEHLEQAGLIKSSLAFQIYARLNGYGSSLQAGDYDFRQTMSTSEIADSIAKGLIVANTFNFTILPGETLADIKAKLITAGYSETEINQAFTRHYDSPVLAGLYDNDGNLIAGAQPLELQLEGYLFGETYQFYNGEAVENIVVRALNELNEVVVGNDLAAKFAENGLSLREGIILASIVQREAKADDMPGVAQVFLNRLRTGMSLGSDVTASYAADIVDPNRQTLTDNEQILNNDNLYNTRLHTGLTPGPISMPSISALKAVANPDQEHIHDLYFLTGDDGKMYYSTTEDGHLRNIRDYCQTYCSVAL